MAIIETGADLRERVNLGMQLLIALLLLVCVLVQLVVMPALFEAAGKLREEREQWQNHVQRELDREREHQQRLEALRQSQLREAASRNSLPSTAPTASPAPSNPVGTAP